MAASSDKREAWCSPPSKGPRRTRMRDSRSSRRRIGDANDRWKKPGANMRPNCEPCSRDGVEHGTPLLRRPTGLLLGETESDQELTPVGVHGSNPWLASIRQLTMLAVSSLSTCEDAFIDTRLDPQAEALSLLMPRERPRSSMTSQSWSGLDFGSAIIGACGHLRSQASSSFAWVGLAAVGWSGSSGPARRVSAYRLASAVANPAPIEPT
jgi:hypothetical protein